MVKGTRDPETSVSVTLEGRASENFDVQQRLRRRCERDTRQVICLEAAESAGQTASGD